MKVIVTFLRECKIPLSRNFEISNLTPEQERRRKKHHDHCDKREQYCEKVDLIEELSKISLTVNDGCYSGTLESIPSDEGQFIVGNNAQMCAAAMAVFLLSNIQPCKEARKLKDNFTGTVSIQWGKDKLDDIVCIEIIDDKSCYINIVHESFKIGKTRKHTRFQHFPSGADALFIANAKRVRKTE
jgi:hypothetical protein